VTPHAAISFASPALTRPFFAVALISLYIPNRVTQSVLLHPIRNNINSSVQQLASVARAHALPIDALQVPIVAFAAAAAESLAR
jgi:hypothetical protein